MALDSVNVNVKIRRGRKPRQESRSTELRQGLIEWQRLPKSSRPSLRALARELNTSHQLLSHYLAGLEEWRRERDLEQFRADGKARGMRLTPAVEKRYLAWARRVEERQAREAAKVADWARKHPEVINWVKEMLVVENQPDWMKPAVDEPKPESSAKTGQNVPEGVKPLPTSWSDFGRRK